MRKVRVVVVVRHRAVERVLVPYFQLHAVTSILIAIYGRPRGPFTPGSVVYDTQGVQVRVSMPGMVEVIGEATALSQFLDWTVARLQAYAHTILHGVYGLKSSIEWSLLKSAAGTRQLIPVPEELVLIQRDGQRVLGRWPLAFPSFSQP